MNGMIKLKTVTFGGYDKDEVNACINRLNELISRNKQEAEEENNKLRKSLEESERLCEELKKENASLKETAAKADENEKIITDDAKKIIKELAAGVKTLLSIIDESCNESENDVTEDDADVADSAVSKDLPEKSFDSELDALINKYI